VLSDQQFWQYLPYLLTYLAVFEEPILVRRGKGRRGEGKEKGKEGERREEKGGGTKGREWVRRELSPSFPSLTQ